MSASVFDWTGTDTAYDSRNCKLLLLRILEEVEHIVSDDYALLPAEDAGGHGDGEGLM
jgi:hypothetical protein